MRKQVSLALFLALLGVMFATTASLAQPDSGERLRPKAKLAPLTHHPQYVAPTGKRKPPGAPLDERGGTTPLIEHHDQEIKDHTLKSICQGAPGCEGGHLRKQGKRD